MNKLDQIFSKDPSKFAVSYIDYLSQILKSIDVNEISVFIQTILDAREQGATIFFIGNGGSASTASHFANDLAIGTNSYDKPFRVLSLTDNQPLITAVANDFGYEEIFIRQLKIYGKPGDVLVGISASGNSQNIIEAFEYANSNNIKTVGLTAFDGGEMRQIANEGIHVQTDMKEYGPAEDAHMVLDHLIVSYLMRLLINENE